MVVADLARDYSIGKRRDRNNRTSDLLQQHWI